MISCSFFLYLYVVFLTLFPIVLLNALFVILNSYTHFKRIESSTKLNPVESFITHCSSEYSVSFHPSLASVLSIIKYYHIISKSRIQFIFPNIIGYNVCQLQTSLTPHRLMQISLFTISYKIHYSGNVYGVCWCPYHSYPCR